MAVSANVVKLDRWQPLTGHAASQVACGGHRTLAVCRHDAEREDSEDRRRGYKGKLRAWLSPATRISVDASERCVRDPGLPMVMVYF